MLDVLGRWARRGLLPVGAARLRDQRLQREPRIGDDRVSHRRAGRLVGIARDRHQFGALREQRAGDVGVVREDRAAHDEHEVIGRQRLADRADGGWEKPLVGGVSLGEPDPSSAGSRDPPDREALLLCELDRGVPGARGVDVGADDHRRAGGGVQLRRQLLHTLRVGSGAPVDRTPDVVGGRVGVDLGAPVVHRDGYERGPSRRERRHVDATRDRVRHILRPRGLVAPLHQRMRHARRVAVGEVGLERHQRRAPAARR